MQSVEDILKRNARVEADKAWETSKTRRALIAAITYITAVTFLKLIGNDAPQINGLVPVGGYLLSTLAFPPIKRWWVERYYASKNTYERAHHPAGEQFEE